MDQIWAPWRLAYITRDQRPKESDDCFICRGLAESDDRKNLIVERTPHGAVILNRFPYNNGHLLIAPSEHKGRLDDLSPDEALELQTTLSRMIRILEREMHPQGFNVGLNLGKVAGAGLPGHMHWHLVPRWDGDTNFMPVFSDVHVMSQSLDSLYDLLVAALKHDKE